jgi:hypothetical protein
MCEWAVLPGNCDSYDECSVCPGVVVAVYKKKLCGLNPWANYTNEVTAACQRI